LAVTLLTEVGRRTIRVGGIAQGNHGLDTVVVYDGFQAVEAHLPAAVENSLPHRVEVAQLRLAVVSVAKGGPAHQKRGQQTQKGWKQTWHFEASVPKTLPVRFEFTRSRPREPGASATGECHLLRSLTLPARCPGARYGLRTISGVSAVEKAVS